MFNNMLVVFYGPSSGGEEGHFWLRLNQQDPACPYSQWRKTVPTLEFNTLLTEQHIGSLLFAPKYTHVTSGLIEMQAMLYCRNV